MNAPPALEAAAAEAGRAPLLFRAYVFWVVLLLPIDWFAPTGNVLREFGAKPVALLLAAGGALGLSRRWWRGVQTRDIEFYAILFFLTWLALGATAALVNFLFGWSGWHHARDPFSQLITQTCMLAAAAVAVVGNVRLFRAYDAVALAARALPWAVVLHLLVFLLEAARILPDNAGPLGSFRVDEGRIDRPTGLFSEPSYYGTFAALYGTALLFLGGSASARLFYRVLAATLYASAVLVGAKTFVVVMGAQAVYFVLRRTTSLRGAILGVMLVLAVAACGIFFIQTYGALDVESNLSSAVRFGSTALAANVAAEGYAMTGIGIGQFHFFYRNEFAPNFLFSSFEAVAQLSPDADDRASTYNLYMRVLIETGVAGLVLLFIALRKLWFSPAPPQVTFVYMLFAGALGFLMTQDTYFYPPLVFSAALIMSMMQEERMAAASYVPQSSAS
jgi:hypothetical protein